MSFSTLTLSSFIDALASSNPTPGGGTASAVAGAMGTALLVMVSGLPRTRGNSDEERAALAGARADLEPIRVSLERCADADTEAFNLVMAAYRQPKATDDEKAHRKAAIAAAMKSATAAPLDTLRHVARALALGVTVAKAGNPSAASDVAVATHLLLAAGEGAAANVRINLDGLADQEFRDVAAEETTRLLAENQSAAAAINTVLGPKS